MCCQLFLCALTLHAWQRRTSGCSNCSTRRLKVKMCGIGCLLSFFFVIILMGLREMDLKLLSLSDALTNLQGRSAARQQSHDLRPTPHLPTACPLPLHHRSDSHIGTSPSHTHSQSHSYHPWQKSTTEVCLRRRIERKVTCPRQVVLLLTSRNTSAFSYDLSGLYPRREMQLE